MDLPKAILDNMPVNWLDDTFIRPHISKQCHDNLSNMAEAIIVKNIDYFHDNDGLVDVMCKHMPIEDMTEEEIGYTVQILMTKCIMIEMVANGYAEQVGLNKWKFKEPE